MCYLLFDSKEFQLNLYIFKLKFAAVDAYYLRE